MKLQLLFLLEKNKLQFKVKKIQETFIPSVTVFLIIQTTPIILISKNNKMHTNILKAIIKIFIHTKQVKKKI
jgi:hypothetical protein